MEAWPQSTGSGSPGPTVACPSGVLSWGVASAGSGSPTLGAGVCAARQATCGGKGNISKGWCNTDLLPSEIWLLFRFGSFFLLVSSRAEAQITRRTEERDKRPAFQDKHILPS